MDVVERGALERAGRWMVCHGKFGQTLLILIERMGARNGAPAEALGEAIGQARRRGPGQIDGAVEQRVLEPIPGRARYRVV